MKIIGPPMKEGGRLAMAIQPAIAQEAAVGRKNRLSITVVAVFEAILAIVHFIFRGYRGFGWWLIWMARDWASS